MQSSSKSARDLDRVSGCGFCGSALYIAARNMKESEPQSRGEDEALSSSKSREYS